MWWFVAACTPSDDAAEPPDGSDPPEDTAPTPVSPPVILAAELLLPGNGVQLARRIRVDTDVPTTLSVSMADGDGIVTLDFPNFATSHEHLLLGLRPGRTYTVEATVAADGASTATELPLETQPLDPFLPVAEVLAHDPSRRAAGDTLLPIRCTRPGQCTPGEMVMVLDAVGEVVYIKDVGSEIVQTAAEYDGGLLVVTGSERSSAILYAWDGTEITRWTLGGEPGSGVVIDVAVAYDLHHDVIPHPVTADRFLAIGRYPLLEPVYPLDYIDPDPVGPTTISADVALEFDRVGVVHREVSLASFFPTTRIGYDSLGVVPQGWTDWAHTNSLWPDGDAWVVSLRNQDAVVKFDPDTSQVVWIAGTHENWPVEMQPYLLAPEGAPFAWHYHQHAAMTVPVGGLTALYLFDNGNWQTVPFTGIAPLAPPPAGAPLPAELYSRVVRYDIDEVAMTIRQVWAFDTSVVAGGSLFSSAVGDVDVLPTGSVLGVFGFLETIPGGQQTNEGAGWGDKSVRVIEFDPDSLEEIWHLHLRSDRTDNTGGFTAYRADRIPALAGRIVD